MSAQHLLIFKNMGSWRSVKQDLCFQSASLPTTPAPSFSNSFPLPEAHAKTQGLIQCNHGCPGYSTALKDRADKSTSPILWPSVVASSRADSKSPILKGTRKTRPPVASACTNCRRRHMRCDLVRPCTGCVKSQQASTCADKVHRKRGRRAAYPKQDQSDANVHHGVNYTQFERSPASDRLSVAFNRPYSISPASVHSSDTGSQASSATSLTHPEWSLPNSDNEAEQAYSAASRSSTSGSFTETLPRYLSPTQMDWSASRHAHSRFVQTPTLNTDFLSKPHPGSRRPLGDVEPFKSSASGFVNPIEASVDKQELPSMHSLRLLQILPWPQGHSEEPNSPEGAASALSVDTRNRAVPQMAIRGILND